jgi:hypothetical protein
MDIDKNEDIYVAEADQRSNPVISVYDAQGKKIGTAMTFQLKNEILEDRAELQSASSSTSIRCSSRF